MSSRPGPPARSSILRSYRRAGSTKAQTAVCRINSAKGRRFSAYGRAESPRRCRGLRAFCGMASNGASDDPTPHLAYGWASQRRSTGGPKGSTISAIPTAELGAISPGDLDTDVGGRASAPIAPGKSIGRFARGLSSRALRPCNPSQRR
jgi:hypothetical protein